MNTNPINCVHHNLGFTYYCESCEEPICQSCTTIGPHNYNLHRINQLQDAFIQRVNHITEEIQHNLLPKREVILAQIHRIEYRIEEIKYVASLIERDCRAEQNGILDRLNQAEGLKLSKLQHQIQMIQQDLDLMNDLGIRYHDLTKSGDQIQFLFESKTLLEKIEFLVAKPYKENIDEIADDLPKELTDLRLQIGKIEGQREVISVLNEIIWNLMNEKKREEDLLSSFLLKESDIEIKEWVKLVDFFQDQLKEQSLVCHFCNKPIDAETVNKKCKQNLSLPQEQQGFTKQKPNDQQIGNGRHFFGHSIDKKLIPKSQKVQKFPPAILIETIISKVRILISENKIKLEEIFLKHDKQSNGLVNQIVFSFILSDILHLQDEDIELILNFMDNKSNINYNTLLDMIKSNDVIFKMEIHLKEKYKQEKKTKAK